MELQGPYGAVTDEHRSPDAGRWVHGFFVSFAEHDRRRLDARSSATSSPSASSDSPAG